MSKAGKILAQPNAFTNAEIEQLRDTVGRQILGYARYRVKKLDAEDVVQETFLRFIKKPKSEVDSPEGLLWQIAHNVLVDANRLKSSHEVQLGEFDDAPGVLDESLATSRPTEADEPSKNSRKKAVRGRESGKRRLKRLPERSTTRHEDHVARLHVEEVRERFEIVVYSYPNGSNQRRVGMYMLKDLVCPQKEIAQSLGLSPERVNQIINNDLLPAVRRHFEDDERSEGR